MPRILTCVSESRLHLGFSGAAVMVSNHGDTICTAHRRLWFDRYRCGIHHSRVTRDVMGNKHYSGVLPACAALGVWRKQRHVTSVATVNESASHGDGHSALVPRALQRHRVDASATRP